VHTRRTQLLPSAALAARLDSPGLRERMPAHGLATRLSTSGTKASLPPRGLTAPTLGYDLEWKKLGY